MGSTGEVIMLVLLTFSEDFFPGVRVEPRTR